MASQTETVEVAPDTITNVPDQMKHIETEELEKLLTSVIYRRKTTPAKCMALRKRIAELEVKRLKNVKIKMEESNEKQKFMKLVHKLKRLEPGDICFDDLHKAERKVMKCLKRLKEINEHLIKRKQYVS